MCISIIPTYLQRFFPNPKENQAWIEITSLDDVPIGSYDMSVSTAGGKSAAKKIYVESLAQRIESEPNNHRDEATVLALPTSVWGTLPTRGEKDLFRFTAKAGETLLFDGRSSKLGSKANLVLRLTDSHGKVLSRQNDHHGESDPLLAFTIPADGEYLVEVRDLLFAGSQEHYYRLSIGAFPFVTGIYPLSVPANQESRIQLVGHNLPKDAQLSIKAGDSGFAQIPLESKEVSVCRSFQDSDWELTRVVGTRAKTKPPTKLLLSTYPER